MIQKVEIFVKNRGPLFSFISTFTFQKEKIQMRDKKKNSKKYLFFFSPMNDSFILKSYILYINKYKAAKREMYDSI